MAVVYSCRLHYCSEDPVWTWPSCTLPWIRLEGLRRYSYSYQDLCQSEMYGFYGERDIKSERWYPQMTITSAPGRHRLSTPGLNPYVTHLLHYI
jgi:hypothetical protein